MDYLYGYDAENDDKHDKKVKIEVRASYDGLPDPYIWPLTLV